MHIGHNDNDDANLDDDLDDDDDDGNIDEDAENTVDANFPGGVSALTVTNTREVN